MAPKHIQLQIFIQANITVGKKLKTCQEQPHLVNGWFIKMFYKTTICLRWPLYRFDCRTNTREEQRQTVKG